MLIRYSQVLRSLAQELLQRIHNGQIMAGNLEETTDLDDVRMRRKDHLNFYSNSFFFLSSRKQLSIGIYENVLIY